MIPQAMMTPFEVSTDFKVGCRDMTATQAFLWINLGSPDSPDVSDVRRYLAEFLMDPFVIDVPFILRVMIVYLTILPSRPKASAEAYHSVWTEEGSPLLVNSNKFLHQVSTRLEYPSYLAMRYGNPSIPSVLEAIREQNPNLKKLVMIPLYPHYAMASTKTVEVMVEREVSRLWESLDLVTIKHFYNHPSYIDALASSMRPYLETNFQHLLFSYHGLPERHLKKTDPTGKWCLSRPDCCAVSHEAHDTCYRHQCYETTRLVTEKLGLTSDQFSVAFQSRLGRDPWIKPFTDEVLITLAQKGVKHLHVVCPAFVSDCLETTIEIGEEYAHIFKENGGEKVQLVESLNDSDKWIECLKGMVTK